MGRTLHYEMKENKAVKVTEENWDTIEKITQYYLDNFKWTCEEPGFSNVDFFPRWPGYGWFSDSKLPRDLNQDQLWDLVNKAYDELKAKGFSRLQAVRDLLSRKLIAISGDDHNHLDLQKARGFTKVAGNEWNAALVTSWLTQISRLLPEHTFTLYDEGEFLTHSSIVIKNGKARTEHGKVWRDVGFYCRPVNPKDFEQHPEFRPIILNMESDGRITSNQAGPSQIMAGFHGEYYKQKSIAETTAKAIA